MIQTDATPLVCIVDDDASVRRAVARVMKSAGIDAREFGSVDECMDSDIGSRPACVVADALMSGGTGIDLTRRLLESGRDLPVILVTAEGNGRLRTQARAAGAVGCFRKPVDAQALVDAIEWALADPGLSTHPVRSAQKEMP